LVFLLFLFLRNSRWTYYRWTYIFTVSCALGSSHLHRLWTSSRWKVVCRRSII
jgi:hypothetical protein